MFLVLHIHNDSKVLTNSQGKKKRRKNISFRRALKNVRPFVTANYSHMIVSSSTVELCMQLHWLSIARFNTHTTACECTSAHIHTHDNEIRMQFEKVDAIFCPRSLRSFLSIVVTSRSPSFPFVRSMHVNLQTIAKNVEKYTKNQLSSSDKVNCVLLFLIACAFSLDCSFWCPFRTEVHTAKEKRRTAR